MRERKGISNAAKRCIYFSVIACVISGSASLHFFLSLHSNVSSELSSELNQESKERSSFSFTLVQDKISKCEAARLVLDNGETDFGYWVSSNQVDYTRTSGENFTKLFDMVEKYGSKCNQSFFIQPVVANVRYVTHQIAVDMIKNCQVYQVWYDDNDFFQRSASMNVDGDKKPNTQSTGIVSYTQLEWTQSAQRIQAISLISQKESDSIVKYIKQNPPICKNFDIYKAT